MDGRGRSGREHWAWMVVVEVRQGTGRGWSWLRSGRDAVARGSQLDKEDEEDEEDEEAEDEGGEGEGGEGGGGAEGS